MKQHAMGKQEALGNPKINYDVYVPTVKSARKKMPEGQVAKSLFKLEQRESEFKGPVRTMEIQLMLAR